MKRVKRPTLISLNIRMICEDEVNSKKEGKIWIPLSDIICIVPEPTATKRALEICPDVLDNVLEKFRVM